MTTNDETVRQHIETAIGRKIRRDEPCIRSCYKCNKTHKHLMDKSWDCVLFCFVCGRYYYRGKVIR